MYLAVLVILVLVIDKNSDLDSSFRYCDKEISSGQNFTSLSGNLVLYFKTQTNYFPGWAASVTFIPIPDCFR